MSPQDTLPTPAPTQKEWGGRVGITADHVREKGGDQRRSKVPLSPSNGLHCAEARQVEKFRLNSSLSTQAPDESEDDETSGRPNQRVRLSNIIWHEASPLVHSKCKILPEIYTTVFNKSSNNSCLQSMTFLSSKTCICYF